MSENAYSSLTIELATQWSASLTTLRESLGRLDEQRAILQRQIAKAESEWLLYETIVRENNV